MWERFCLTMGLFKMPVDSSRKVRNPLEILIEMACQELDIQQGMVGFKIHLDGAEVCPLQGAGLRLLSLSAHLLLQSFSMLDAFAPGLV